MEPANLIPPSSEDPLDGLLRTRSHAIPDDGFSQRVVAALPPPSTAFATAQPFIVVTVGAAAGLAFAFWQGASWNALAELCGRLADAVAPLAASLSNPWLILALGLAVAASSLVVAFSVVRHENRRR